MQHGGCASPRRSQRAGHNNREIFDPRVWPAFHTFLEAAYATVASSDSWDGAQQVQRKHAPPKDAEPSLTARACTYDPRNPNATNYANRSTICPVVRTLPLALFASEAPLSPTSRDAAERRLLMQRMYSPLPTLLDFRFEAITAPPLTPRPPSIVSLEGNDSADEYDAALEVRPLDMLFGLSSPLWKGFGGDDDAVDTPPAAAQQAKEEVPEQAPTSPAPPEKEKEKEGEVVREEARPQAKSKAAAKKKPRGRSNHTYHAVVVAVGAYDDVRLEPCVRAVTDAEAVAALLRLHGYTVDLLSTDSLIAPTKQHVLLAIRAALERVPPPPEDVVDLGGAAFLGKKVNKQAFSQCPSVLIYFIGRVVGTVTSVVTTGFSYILLEDSCLTDPDVDLEITRIAATLDANGNAPLILVDGYPCGLHPPVNIHAPGFRRGSRATQEEMVPKPPSDVEYRDVSRSRGVAVIAGRAVGPCAFEAYPPAMEANTPSRNWRSMGTAGGLFSFYFKDVLRCTALTDTRLFLTALSCFVDEKFKKYGYSTITTATRLQSGGGLKVSGVAKTIGLQFKTFAHSERETLKQAKGASRFYVTALVDCDLLHRFGCAGFLSLLNRRFDNLRRGVHVARRLLSAQQDLVKSPFKVPRKEMESRRRVARRVSRRASSQSRGPALPHTKRASRGTLRTYARQSRQGSTFACLPPELPILKAPTLSPDRDSRKASSTFSPFVTRNLAAFSAGSGSPAAGVSEASEWELQLSIPEDAAEGQQGATWSASAIPSEAEPLDAESEDAEEGEEVEEEEEGVEDEEEDGSEGGDEGFTVEVIDIPDKDLLVKALEDLKAKKAIAVQRERDELEGSELSTDESTVSKSSSSSTADSNALEVMKLKFLSFHKQPRHKMGAYTTCHGAKHLRRLCEIHLVIATCATEDRLAEPVRGSVLTRSAVQWRHAVCKLFGWCVHATLPQSELDKVLLAGYALPVAEQAFALTGATTAEAVLAYLATHTDDKRLDAPLDPVATPVFDPECHQAVPAAQGGEDINIMLVASDNVSLCVTYGSHRDYDVMTKLYNWHHHEVPLDIGGVPIRALSYRCDVLYYIRPWSARLLDKYSRIDGFRGLAGLSVIAEDDGNVAEFRAALKIQKVYRSHRARMTVLKITSLLITETKARRAIVVESRTLIRQARSNIFARAVASLASFEQDMRADFLEWEGEEWQALLISSFRTSASSDLILAERRSIARSEKMGRLWLKKSREMLRIYYEATHVLTWQHHLLSFHQAQHEARHLLTRQEHKGRLAISNARRMRLAASQVAKAAKTVQTRSPKSHTAMSVIRRLKTGQALAAAAHTPPADQLSMRRTTGRWAAVSPKRVIAAEKENSTDPPAATGKAETPVPPSQPKPRSKWEALRQAKLPRAPKRLAPRLK